MIKEVKLKTLNLINDISPDDPDYQLWKKIFAYMDGEIALASKSSTEDGLYVFLGLKDKEKDKELHYMFDFAELEQYRAIGTVKECRMAMERQTAKIPDTYGDGYDRDGNMIIDMYECPGCGQTYEMECDHYKYCPECGQAIDRSNLI